MPLNRSLSMALAGLLLSATVMAAQQVPIGAGASTGATMVARAEGMASSGRGVEATELLGRYLSETPTDGRAWFFLGRIYLGELKRWHTNGHQGEPSGPILIDLASVAFNEAQQLMTDSGGVFRALVTIESAISRIEESGWQAGMAGPRPAEELPLPTVIAELGENLLASCPTNGVLITGTDVEVAAVWGKRLLGNTRTDLILLRPDRYQLDPVYRLQMARLLGVDPSNDVKAAMARIKVRRPICLGPGLDTMSASGLGWRPEQLVMVAGVKKPVDSLTKPTELAVYQLSRVGLAGSVWSAPVRELYETAARLNPSLCKSLFNTPDPGFPAILSCPH